MIKPVPLPINTPPFKDIDTVGIKELSDAAIDVTMDAAQNTTSRPGLTEVLDLGNDPIDGIYYYYPSDRAIISSGGIHYKVDSAYNETAMNAVATETGVTRYEHIVPDVLSPKDPLFILANFKMYHAPAALNAVTLLYTTDSDSPQTADSMCMNSSRIVAVKGGTDYLHFSDKNDGTSWSALSYVAAEGAADPVFGLASTKDGVYALGGLSTEVFYAPDDEDPTTVYRVIPQARMNVGTREALSVVQDDNSIFFLDQFRRFSKITQYNSQVISDPINRVVAGLTVTGAYGYRLVFEGYDWIVWQFPSSCQTWVYDLKTGHWYQWGRWIEDSEEYSAYIGRCAYMIPKWGVTLVGSRLDGKVYKMDRSSYADGDKAIRPLRRTGWLTHGEPGTLKHPAAIKLVAKRGYGASGGSPQLKVRWRDNWNNTWKTTRTYDLGGLGDTEALISVRGLGSYYSRQYEFFCEDSVPIMLVNGTEYLKIRDK